MAKITVIANILARADHIDLVKAELLKLIDTSRAEAGCINYNLHQDYDNPAHFLTYENWESRELWLKHTNNQHLRDFIAAAQDSIEGFNINEMTKYN